MRKVLFTAIMACMVCALNAQTEVSAFRPGVTLDGVNYFLPKTRIRVIVEAEKSVTQPGDFAVYANKYLRLDDVPTTPVTTWTLKRVSLLAYGVPDSSKAFSIKVKSKTSAPLVSLTEDGLLLSVNTEAQPERLPELPQGQPATKLINARDYMTRDILSAGSTAKMAQLTAEEIYDLRESRDALNKGEADNTPKDGAQLKLMLDNLSQQIAALESLFKGQSQVSTEVFAVDYEPKAVADGEQSAETKELLFRFSRYLGLVDADDLSGEPVWVAFKPQGNLPQAQQNEETQKKKAKMEQGLYVNQPVNAQISLTMGKQTLVKAEMPVAQLGTTEVLSDALFNKQMNTRVTLHQHTGSVKSIE